MKTVNDIKISESHLNNESYNFQPTLTSKLDDLSADFNQDIINQIVLWKVNRYAELDNDTLILLNRINKYDNFLDKVSTHQILERLLKTRGIRLAMASTILRFKNPKVYQIIEQRVYRIIYGKPMPKHTSAIDAQIILYFDYLEKLRGVCDKHGIDFDVSDRVLYELDKEFNKGVKITY